jgi:hypothetical protein
MHLRFKLADFQRAALCNQEQLKSQLKEMRRVLLRISGGNFSTIDSAGTAEGAILATQLPSIPIQTEDNLREFEVWLEEGKNYETLVSMMTRLGGAVVSKNVFNILRFIISADMARLIRYTSTSGKIAFRELKLAQAVRGSLIPMKVSSLHLLFSVIY